MTGDAGPALWMTEARRSVTEFAQALGYDGSHQRGYACPACKESKRGRSGRRGPVGLTRNGAGWCCFMCDAKGSGLDFLAFHLFGKGVGPCEGQQRRQLRTWCADRGWCSASGARAEHPRIAAPAPRPSPTMVRPPAEEVAAYWRDCWALDAPARDEWGGTAHAFLTRRGYAGLVRTIVAKDLARWAPPPARRPTPRWWDPRWPEVYRLVVRAFEADGCLGSLHARAIMDLPTAGLRPAPKTRWPRHPEPDHSYDAAELLFACPLAQDLLRRVHVPQLGAVLVCEGLTDWLHASALLHDCMTTMGASSPDYPRLAVFGAAAGGFRALRKVRWPEGHYEVWCATDHDLAGDRYALEIAEAVPRPIKRGDQVRRFLERRSDRVDPRTGDG